MRSFAMLLVFFASVRPSQFNVSFPIALPLVRVGRSVGEKKKKRERTLERAWVPGKAGLLSTKAWLQSQLKTWFLRSIFFIYNGRQ